MGRSGNRERLDRIRQTIEERPSRLPGCQALTTRRSDLRCRNWRRGVNCSPKMNEDAFSGSTRLKSGVIRTPRMGRCRQTRQQEGGR